MYQLLDPFVIVLIVRVVSLVPSMTESLFSSSASIVGVTRYCEVEGYTIVGGTKDPAIEEIVDLAPDLVILDKHENRREDYEELSKRGLTVFATSIASVEDLIRDFNALNASYDLNLPLIEDNILSHLSINQNTAPEIPNHTRDNQEDNQRAPIRALVPIWRNPYMAINSKTYAGDLLRRIGVEVVGGETEYSKIDLETFRGKVDVILAPSEPYKFTKRQLPELTKIVSRVEFVDGKDLFWWGTRTPGALDRLCLQIARLGLGPSIPQG